MTKVTPEDVAKMLEHSGVLGMRWGVRTEKHGSSGATKKPKVSAISKLKADPEHANVNKMAVVKGHTRMSNDELKRVNERLKLEDSFQKLNPLGIKKGHEKAKAILEIASTVSALLVLAQTPAAKKVYEAVKAKVMG